MSYGIKESPGRVGAGHKFPKPEMLNPYFVIDFSVCNIVCCQVKIKHMKRNKKKIIVSLYFYFLQKRS